MTEDHHLHYVWVKDAKDQVLAVMALTPAQKPMLSFELPEGMESITAFCACNL
jgi:desulfoferrodoxin (superoxide reductase-like protein)